MDKNLDLSSIKFKYIEQWSNYFSTFMITYDESNNKYLSDVFHKRDFEQDTEFDDVKSKINKLKQFPHRLIAEAIGYSTHNPFYEYSFTIIYKCDLSFSLFNLFELIRKGEVVENYNNTSRYIILAGISRAMKYIYQINIGPQMLRPSSILLDNEFYPKIIPEFNMITYFFVPTMSYPPQLKDTIYLPNDDIEYEQEKTDVYAFAFIAYEILTGLNPCSFYSKYDHRSRKEEIRPKFNDSVSHDFQSLIESCWSSDPEKRPTFENIFKYIAFDADKKAYPSDFDYGKFENYVNTIK